MEVDDNGRENMVGNTCNGNAWPCFTNEHPENLSLYIYRTIKASSGEIIAVTNIILLIICLYSPERFSERLFVKRDQAFPLKYKNS